jgi:hypothetical protein
VPEEKLVFAKSFEDKSCDVMMLFNGFCENEDVVEVDTDDVFHDEVLENVVHHGLEGGEGVNESEKHHQGFKEAMVHLKCCLPFVAFLHAYIVVLPSYVKLCEVLCTLKLVD